MSSTETSLERKMIGLRFVVFPEWIYRVDQDALARLSVEDMISLISV